MEMKNNTVLITGGATGIGLELARQLIALENTVIVCGRRSARLAEAKELIPELHTISCDVTITDDRDRLMAEIKRSFPDINVLINNAGIQQNIDLSKGSEDLVKDQLIEIDINLKAPIYLAGLFIDYFKEKSIKGTIINVSSGLGFIPMARVPVYCATKAALHSFTMSLRHQLKNLGISVIEIIPPAVVSELNSTARAKSGANRFAVPTDEYVISILAGLEEGSQEISYGSSDSMRQASRAEIDVTFARMNGGS